MRDLRIRNKLLAVVLPLVLVPVLGIGLMAGYLAREQARQGITQAIHADLDHLASFTLDLLNAHYQQFGLYQEDKRQAVYRDLATLVRFAHNVVLVQQEQVANGTRSLAAAQEEARRIFKSVSVGKTGYLYAMTRQGRLVVHIAQEGEDVLEIRDEHGRPFLREMIEQALIASVGEIRYITYPWRNALLGETQPRNKVAAYLYFPPWDWIIAASGYLEETYEDVAFEQQALRELKRRILSKPVGVSGSIYAMTRQGVLTLHPTQEGKNIYDQRDADGRLFIQEMTAQRRGWLRYPWQESSESTPRMKIARYEYFAPWDWIVVVGSYEDEFYAAASAVEQRILGSVALITGMVGFIATLLVWWAARRLTDPIQRLIAGVREVRQGRLETLLVIEANDELGELAEDFNRMIETLRRNKELEAHLAQENKMAALGVLSSGVAHEINNPLGVILGYAAYLEGKLDAADPYRKYVQEIRQESQRCKTIVQDLLSYARVPRPALAETDLNALLAQIVDFAAHHTDLSAVEMATDFAPDLPRVWVDGDQIRQVAMNLLLNAGGAMPNGGRLVVSTRLGAPGRVEVLFQDSGCGIPPEHLEKIFEPFFTTKARGTGLGLAITKTIVDRHGGTLRITSTVGIGTCVTVSLPVRPESGI